MPGKKKGIAKVVEEAKNINVKRAVKKTLEELEKTAGNPTMQRGKIEEDPRK